MYLADKLGKPVLAEGPAGVGKTELAKAYALATGRKLIRLQCYEGLDESKALYEWEYAKQMLYTQLLRDKLSDMLSKTMTLREAADRLGAEESVFFSERFLLARPLLQALTSDEPVVLLIDEIDRADAEFEAFLLEILSDFQVSVPELGTIKARHMPTVVLTSNNTRELSEALKGAALPFGIIREEAKWRSCGARAELNAKMGSRPSSDANSADGLKKSPSVAETIAGAFVVMQRERGQDR